FTATSTATACASLEMSMVGSGTVPSYGVTMLAIRRSARSGESAASSAVRNSGLFASSVGLEKMSVKVDPPDRGSSRSMSWEARPDSDVVISPPDSSFPPCAATKAEATRSSPELPKTHHRRLNTNRPQAANITLTLPFCHYEVSVRATSRAMRRFESALPVLAGPGLDGVRYFSGRGERAHRNSALHAERIAESCGRAGLDAL